MNSKNTIILAIVTFAILVVAVIAGVTTQQPQQPAPQPAKQQTAKPLPSATELASQLAEQQPAINLVLTESYPKINELYTVNPGKLYQYGDWYGTTLTYKGPDVENRDTLRVLMQKKDGVWKLLTKPPKIILRSSDYPAAPTSVIQDINQPAPLPGTDASPAIN